MKEKRNEFPVVIDIDIAWGHMDSFQHVNNVMFFRYYESARIAYFEKIGFLKYMEKTGIGPILAKTSCKYIAPLKYPDKISVGAKVTKINENKFEMIYRVVSKNKDHVVAEGDSLIVSYDYKNSKKALLPQKIVNAIDSIESTL